MEFQPITTFCRVRKVEKKTGNIVATTYTKMTDNNGNHPNAEDVFARKYADKENDLYAFVVSECSEGEYIAKKQLPAKERSTDFLREDVYEEMRLAQYSRDYSALCGLVETIPRKALVNYFTE